MLFAGENGEYEGVVIQGGIGGNVDIWVGGDGSYITPIFSGNINSVGIWLKSFINKILPKNLEI